METRYRDVIESIPSAILVSDSRGRIILANKRAVSLFGYSRDEFEALNIEDLINPAKRESHVAKRAEFSKSPSVRVMGERQELSAMRKDGTEFPAEIGLSPLSEPATGFVVSSVHDISSRKRTERQLRNNARLLEFHAVILDNVYDAVFFVDGDSRVGQWNLGAERLFGITSGEALGVSLDELVPLAGSSLSSLLPAPGNKNFVESEIRLNRIDSEEMYLRIRSSRLGKGKVLGTIYCAIDITEQRKIEAELTRVAEEEQQRIGRDIHDDLCSQLSGIGCMIKALETQFRESHEKEATLMESISEMVAAAGVKAREIARGLNPEALLRDGLAEAIREYAAQQREIYDVEISVNDKINERELESLSRETATQLFRIAQEAISNAVRHSGAESIELSLSEADGAIVLSISDNGRGIQESRISAGMGLTTMQRRADLIGASFDIHTTPASGTTIQCILPR
ncbi:MAG: hypothetical protein CMO55_08355 [Verrucomicrobiales bacterium]|nr:hypothetical protein [Verrucomicrobiales bacterium]